MFFHYRIASCTSLMSGWAVPFSVLSTCAYGAAVPRSSHRDAVTLARRPRGPIPTL